LARPEFVVKKFCALRDGPLVRSTTSGESGVAKKLRDQRDFTPATQSEPIDVALFRLPTPHDGVAG
jgi:hypothetical protein